MRVLHDLYLRTCALADRGPVLVVVDDLYLADEASVQWLAHLALRMDDVPVAMVVTARTGERGRGAAYSAVVEDPRTQRIGLGNLTPRELLKFTTAMFGVAPEESFHGACYDARPGATLCWPAASYR
jgi:hypothetical protein